MQAMRTLNSRLFFVGLQLADLLTTLACFHYGLVEINPLNAHLIASFGILTGLIISKVLACAVMLRIKKLIWVGNVAYLLIVIWNSFLAGVGAITAIANGYPL